MENVYKHFLENKLAYGFRKSLGKSFLPLATNKPVDISVLKMAAERSNWVLPFDSCSLFTAEDRILAVKFEEHEELPNHIPSLQDTHSFTYIIGGEFAITGKFCIMEKNYNNEEGIVPINEGDLKDALILLKDLGTFNEVEYELFIIVQAELIASKHQVSMLPSAGQASIWTKTQQLANDSADMSDIAEAIDTFNNNPDMGGDTLPYVELKEDLMKFINTFSLFMLDTKNFVVESKDVKYKPSTKKYKPVGISLYSILHINIIRKQYVMRIKTDNGETLTVGYERRKHLRTYKHHRYTKMRGKTVVIKSVWIGPTEAVDKFNNHLYKVHINTK